jgi:hypothetical protein
MAQVPNIKRNLEQGQMYIPLWHSGINVQRSPLFTPISALGVQIISRYDTLWGGSNMELSLANTLVRRPGFPKACTQAFGAGEWPTNFYSYQNLAGAITPLVDTQIGVYSFTSSALTLLFTKTVVDTNGQTVPTNQTNFQRVGQQLIFVNGVDIKQMGISGTLGTVIPVGIGVPTVAPAFTIGNTGFLDPTTGFTFGYSYANSTTGQVSTMSPISADVGDLDVVEVTESQITYPISDWSATGGTVTFGTPNGNNLWIGAQVQISVLPGFILPLVLAYGYVNSSRPAGFQTAGNNVVDFPSGGAVTIVGSGDSNFNGNWNISSVYPTSYANGITYCTLEQEPHGDAAGGGTVASTGYPPITSWTATVTAIGAGTFSASTASWGSGYASTTFDLSTLTGCNAVLSPITIPGSSAANPYVYTVNQAANFAPTNGYGAATPSPMSVTGPGGTPVYTQISSGTPSTGQFVVDVSTGQITFAAADAGNAIVLKYAVTPQTGGTPVSFVLTAPSSNNAFTGGTQGDITGYAQCDSVIVYRDNDTDTTAGPWYFLATIPNNVALASANFSTSGSGASTTIYTFTTPVPAGNNNGFAGAINSKGATIAGFTNSGNNGNFDIIASTTTSITCSNPNGVDETHAATVNSGNWTYTDTGAVYGYAFDFTVPDGELDILIEAPIDHENDPPPNVTNPNTPTATGTFTLIAYNAGRLWGAIDNYVYFAGGADITFGSPTESWPPANVFTFPGTVTALLSTTAGLVVFTVDDMYVIYGTSTATFYSQLYQREFGVASQNSVISDGDSVYIYTSQGQLWSFTTDLQEIGSSVSPYLDADFTPSTTSLTFHHVGDDQGLFICDGSTNYMKYRPDQGSWSPLCQIVGGVGFMKSIETAPNIYTLCAGIDQGSGYILARDATGTVFQDNGTSYTCSAIVGSLIVAPPGSISLIEYIAMQYAITGSVMTLSILVNEIADINGNGPWQVLGFPVNDPPKLLPSTTLRQQRYYLKNSQWPVPQEMNHMMLRLAFPAENYKAEVLSLTVA